MVFANEDAILYICRYLHPDDITALARADHSIRAMMMPHMRYVMRTISIPVGCHQIIRKEVIRARFARIDTMFTIPSADFIMPDPVPHDHTGLISLRWVYMYGGGTIVHLWTSAGFVYRVLYRYTPANIISVAKTDRIHFADYLRKSVDDNTHRYDADAPLIANIWNTARALVDDDLSKEFRNLLRFDLLWP